jgi:hypothetical protein
MEGFIALAVFAEQMSNPPEKPRSTQDSPTSNQPEEGLLAMQNSSSAAGRCKVHVEDTPPATESIPPPCPARED